MMNKSPYPSVKSVVSDQKARNKEASQRLEQAQQILARREKRHKGILTFTKKFLEKPNKGFLGRFLYDILWRTAEKLEEE